MHPTVDVVIPCFNQGRFVGVAIDSALNQTSAPGRVIVVDDGSTDTTATECLRYGTSVTYVHQENAGLSAARNTAIAHSKADFVQLLDADDALKPTALAELLETAAKHPDASIVRGGWDEIDASGRVVASVHETELCDDQFHSLFDPISIGPPCRYLIRRAAFTDVGGFDTTLRSCEDWDMWLRLVLHGHRIASCNAITCDYRRHPQSMSRDHRRMWESGLEVLERARTRHDCERCVSAYRSGIERWREYCYLSILREDIRRDIRSRRPGGAALRAMRAVRHDPKLARMIGASIGRNLRLPHA